MFGGGRRRVMGLNKHYPPLCCDRRLINALNWHLIDELAFAPENSVTTAVLLAQEPNENLF